LTGRAAADAQGNDARHGPVMLLAIGASSAYCAGPRPDEGNRMEVGARTAIMFGAIAWLTAPLAAARLAPWRPASAASGAACFAGTDHPETMP